MNKHLQTGIVHFMQMRKSVMKVISIKEKGSVSVKIALKIKTAKKISAKY